MCGEPSERRRQPRAAHKKPAPAQKHPPRERDGATRARGSARRLISVGSRSPRATQLSRRLQRFDLKLAGVTDTSVLSGGRARTGEWRSAWRIRRSAIGPVRSLSAELGTQHPPATRFHEQQKRRCLHSGDVIPSRYRRYDRFGPSLRRPIRWTVETCGVEAGILLGIRSYDAQPWGRFEMLSLERSLPSVPVCRLEPNYNVHRRSQENSQIETFYIRLALSQSSRPLRGWKYPTRNTLNAALKVCDYCAVGL
ncbi:unnamed protein product, partial [Iphiclides podalirius]